MRKRAHLCSVLTCWLAACTTHDLHLGADLKDAQAPDSAIVAAAPPATSGAAGMGPSAQAAAGLAPCSAERADCDGDLQNGCETHLMSDAAHCGRCGRSCQSADCVCRDGELQVVCPTGRADCDQDLQNGCEVDTLTSKDHCGACGKSCHIGGHDAITATCTAGRCHITCQMEISPEGDCDGNPDNGCETSLWTNENCGACGVRCVCSAGVCR
jgi:hypothetical protein